MISGRTVIGLLLIGPCMLAAPGAERPASGTDVHRGAIDIGDALFIARYNVGLRGPWIGRTGDS